MRTTGPALVLVTVCLPVSIVIALLGVVGYDVPLGVFIAAVVFGLATRYRFRN
jgi:hypothetical protein